MRWYQGFLATLLLTACAGPTPRGPVERVVLSVGDLQATFVDNANSPAVLSGIQSLFHRQSPDFDAFDPDTPGHSAGLNYEHIIAGHRRSENKFEPRERPMYLIEGADGHSVVFARDPDDSLWQVGSRFTITLHAPHYLDFSFACDPQSPDRFGKRRYAVFFFASYMNEVLDAAITFPGVREDETTPGWVEADAPPGHPDYDGGGTYRAAAAAPLAYDRKHNAEHNLWSYESPRISEPFYFGRLANDFVWAIFFDRLHTASDEIRFSVFKYKLPGLLRPAWDFQYVLRDLEAPCGFSGRALYKPWAGAEDVRAEYERWRASRP